MTKLCEVAQFLDLSILNQEIKAAIEQWDQKKDTRDIASAIGCKESRAAYLVRVGRERRIARHDTLHD